MRHHNTTNETGGVLSLFENKAKGQELKVLKFYRQHPYDYFSPSDIWKMLFEKRVPITSVRRAITNLTKSGWLFKTEYKKEGAYGRPEYCWGFAHS